MTVSRPFPPPEPLGCRLLGALLLLVVILLLAGCAEALPSGGGTTPGASNDDYAEGGINEGASRLPTGPQSGLWAGNVETIPGRPVALPDSFYQKPTGDPVPYPDDLPLSTTDTVTFKDPKEVGSVLWVFADGIDKTSLDQTVEAAVKEGRVVVVYGRHYRDLVGFVAPRPPLDPWNNTGLVLSWAPWNEQVPHSNSPYYFTPPEFDRPTKEAIYMVMAAETLAEVRPREGLSR